MKNFDPADFCLREMQVEEFGTHMVFINMEPGAPSLESMAGSIVDEFRDAVPDYDDLVLCRKDPFEIDVNWKIAIGNFAECYHCPFAHPEFMGSATSLFETERWKNMVRPYYSSHIVYKARPENRAYGFNPCQADMVDGYIWALWPNTLFMAWPPSSNFIVFQVYPTGPEQTYESLDYYFRSNPPSEKEEEVVKYHSDVVNEQDIAIIRSVQRGVKSRGYNQGRFVVDDFDSWRSEPRRAPLRADGVGGAERLGLGRVRRRRTHDRPLARPAAPEALALEHFIGAERKETPAARSSQPPLSSLAPIRSKSLPASPAARGAWRCSVVGWGRSEAKKQGPETSKSQTARATARPYSAPKVLSGPSVGFGSLPFGSRYSGMTSLPPNEARPSCGVAERDLPGSGLGLVEHEPVVLHVVPRRSDSRSAGSAALHGLRKEPSQ